MLMPLNDREIIPRLKDIKAGIPGGSYAIDRAIRAMERELPTRPEGGSRVDQSADLCGKCGTSLNHNWDFCPRCGQKIGWELRR